LCTTGSAKSFVIGGGAVCGFGGSLSHLTRGSGSALESAPSFAASGSFTVPKMPVAPKPCPELESSGHAEFEAFGPAGVVGLSINSGLRCDAGSINHSLLPIYLFSQKRFCV
jgi:hypothetical protein